MTNSNGLFCRPTDGLVQPAKAKFYPLRIPIPHPQLRNLISTVEQDWVYFATDNDIYALHVPSQRRLLLVTVPFIPRCLAAGLGWICVGGQSKGDCAFIKLSRYNSPSRSQASADVAAYVQGISAGRTTSHDKIDHWWQHPELVVQELGGDIVNSITIHEMSNGDDSDMNEPVALLSNNDKSVKIYSLSQRKVIATLTHPIPMNFALISPDSETLTAVGDGNRAFFYRRTQIPNKSIAGATSKQVPQYEWQLFAVPKLPIGEHSSDDYCFSIAYSPSGHLCAVSSQGGMISVFDMETLKSISDSHEHVNASICSFRSSRVALWGYVRSMAFSPEPWDLLAWAEDHGRVGIADLRQAFCRRQVVELETHALGLERVVVEDVTPPSIKNLDTKGRLLHQYRERLQIENETTAIDPLLEPPETLSELLRRQPLGADLDERERSVLDALDVTMEEIYQASLNPHLPYSVHYTSSPRVNASIGSGERNSSSPGFDNIVENVWRERIDVLAERHLERTRNGDRYYLPRRRSSVVLSHNATSNIGTSTGLAPQAVSRSGLTASPSQLSQTEDDTVNNIIPPIQSTNDSSPTVENSETRNRATQSDSRRVPQSALDPARHATTTMVSSTGGPTANPVRSEAAAAAERRFPLGSVVPRATEVTTQSAQTLAVSSTYSPAQPYQANSQQPQSARRAAAALAHELETERLARETSTMSEERHQRILEARAQARQRVAAANSVINASGSRNDTERIVGRLSEIDVRLARLMMMSSARSVMDRNGNWVAGETLERLMTGRSVPGADANGLGGIAASELAREMGVGTAGVGWSPDGRILFVGTQEGIFEYPVNLADRKTFPVFNFC